jgi:hypothetical protein
VRSLIDKIVMHDRPADRPGIALIGDNAKMVKILMPCSETQKAALGRAAFVDRTVRSISQPC